MGQILEKLSERFRSLFGNRDVKLLMLGLDAAGKTTILYQLKLAENVTTIPTIGFNVENVHYRKLNLMIWDLGGQDLIRRLWRHYYAQTDAVIYVVDSADKERLSLAQEELHKVMSDDLLRDAKLLVLANKQDLPRAADGKEIVEKLSLDNIRQTWFMQPCSATRGEGLLEGLEWLNNAL